MLWHAQSKNQVMIIEVFLNIGKDWSSVTTIPPTELEKRDCHPTSLLPPGLQTLFFTFTMFLMCPVQKWN